MVPLHHRGGPFPVEAFSVRADKFRGFLRPVSGFHHRLENGNDLLGNSREGVLPDGKRRSPERRDVAVGDQGVPVVQSPHEGQLRDRVTGRESSQVNPVLPVSRKFPGPGVVHVGKLFRFPSELGRGPLPPFSQKIADPFPVGDLG